LQFEAYVAPAQHTKKCGLHLLKLLDMRRATHALEHRDFARHLNLSALFNRHHTKRLSLLMASLNQVEVAHLKYLKMKRSIRKQNAREGEKWDGMLHGYGRLRFTLTLQSG
jgi:hypothetical protein